LIASDKVEGTAVYNRNGDRLGSVYNFMVNKRSGGLCGDVVWAVFSEEGLAITRFPELTHDTSRGGYVVNLTKEQLRGAPTYSCSEVTAWEDARIQVSKRCL
jgi:PRC-barrel domain protein